MNSPLETIEAYVEATRRGDVATLQTLFAPTALMSGYFQGEFYSGTPEPFYDEMRDNPSAAESGEPYSGDIIHIEIYDAIAQVTVKEKSYLGFDLVNLFHLARIDDRWLILSKMYIEDE